MIRLLSLSALALAGLISVAGSTAAAEPRSWTAAKTVIPEHVTVIAGASFTSLRATTLYQSLIPPLIAKEPDARLAFDTAKATCALDLHTAIDDATMAIGDDERGVIVLALGRGLDQKRILECMNKVFGKLAKEKAPVATTGAKAKAKRPAGPPPKITVTMSGKIAAYGVAGEPSKLHVAWLAPDVAAIATDPEDRALLEKMIAGKGARGSLAGAAGKVNVNATVWFATTKQANHTGAAGKVNVNATVWFATTKQAPMQGNGTMKAMFGAINAAGGQVNVDTHAIMGSAKEAQKLVADATQLIRGVKDQVPAQFTKVVEALKLAAVGNDATMKLSLSEKDLLTILSLVMSTL